MRASREKENNSLSRELETHLSGVLSFLTARYAYVLHKLHPTSNRHPGSKIRVRSVIVHADPATLRDGLRNQYNPSRGRPNLRDNVGIGDHNTRDLCGARHSHMGTESRCDKSALAARIPALSPRVWVEKVNSTSRA